MLEQGPLRFDVREVLLALILAAAFFDQAVLVPDAFQRAVTDGEIELADQASCAKGGQGGAEFDELRFESGRSFVGLPVTCARLFHEARRAVLLIAAEPLADRGHGGSEQARGGLEAALSGRFHQAETMVVSVFPLTDQIEIASGGSHGERILLTACRPAPPPPPGGRFFPPPRTDAFQLH